MKQKRIAVVGPINADIMVIGDYQGDWKNSFEWTSPADISLCVAGSSGYTLQDFALLGNHVKVFSAIGDGGIGVGLKSQMEQMGIDTHLLTVHEGKKTAVAVYWLMHGNKKRPFAYEMSPFPPWPQNWDDITEDDLLDADLLHCGGYLHYSEVYFGKTAALFRHARERGLLTSIDTQFPLSPSGTKTPWMLNMTDVLPYVDVLIMDETEARMMTGEQDLDSAIDALMQHPVSVLAVKMGREGSVVVSRQERIRQCAVSVGETVDSIGAGDAYGAAFLTYYLEGRSPADCARFASTVAGFTVTAAGGVRGMPSRDGAETYIQAKEVWGSSDE